MPFARHLACSPGVSRGGPRTGQLGGRPQFAGLESWATLDLGCGQDKVKAEALPGWNS